MKLPADDDAGEPVPNTVTVSVILTTEHTLVLVLSGSAVELSIAATLTVSSGGGP